MRLIPLTQGKFAKIDDEDFKDLSKYKWFTTKFGNKFYAFRNHPQVNGVRNHIVLMHRHILALPRKTSPRIEVDHIDGDGLNNQRDNIRACTSSQNKMNRAMPATNTSGFKGVTKIKGNNTNPWRAQIRIDGKQTNIGHFSTERQAYKAYLRAAKKYHGDFAHV